MKTFKGEGDKPLKEFFDEKIKVMGDSEHF
jgi:hypothetical protein